MRPGLQWHPFCEEARRAKRYSGKPEMRAQHKFNNISIEQITNIFRTFFIVRLIPYKSVTFLSILYTVPRKLATKTLCWLVIWMS